MSFDCVYAIVSAVAARPIDEQPSPTPTPRKVVAKSKGVFAHALKALFSGTSAFVDAPGGVRTGRASGIKPISKSPVRTTSSSHVSTVAGV